MYLIPFNKSLPSFEPFFDSSMKPFFSDFSLKSDMKIDISENEKEYILKADVPGVDQKDIDIIIKDNILTITAKHEEEKNEEKENYIRRERLSGTTSRSFGLEGINDQDIKASFDKGILTLTLPKEKETKPSYRKIELE